MNLLSILKRLEAALQGKQNGLKKTEACLFSLSTQLTTTTVLQFNTFFHFFVFPALSAQTKDPIFFVKMSKKVLRSVQNPAEVIFCPGGLVFYLILAFFGERRQISSTQTVALRSIPLSTIPLLYLFHKFKFISPQLFLKYHSTHMPPLPQHPSTPDPPTQIIFFLINCWSVVFPIQFYYTNGRLTLQTRRTANPTGTGC